MQANYLRLGSILAFIVGSAIGAWVFVKLGYKGFILPGFIASYTAWQGKKAKVLEHVYPCPSHKLRSRKNSE